ncbi:unnamed protein product [Malus baccata var. baccata]
MTEHQPDTLANHNPHLDSSISPLPVLLVFLAIPSTFHNLSLLLSPPHKPLILQALNLLMASNTLMSCGIATTAFPSVLSSSKSKFATSAVQLPSIGANASSRFSMSAEWMPGEPRPPYLDGSAPGDFGFDPLRLGEVPENLERFKESELIHCRWAMLAVPGILVPEALGLGNWVKAQEWAAVPGGQATYLGNPVPWGTLPTILVIEFLSIAFVEHQRSMEKDPEKKKYPGGAFDPLGYSKDPKKFAEYKVKEVKNG